MRRRKSHAYAAARAEWTLCPPALLISCGGIVRGACQTSKEPSLTWCALTTQVIPDLGVGVTLYEILDIQGGTIYPLEGAAMFKVTFSLVRFGSVTNS